MENSINDFASKEKPIKVFTQRNSNAKITCEFFDQYFIYQFKEDYGEEKTLKIFYASIDILTGPTTQTQVNNAATLVILVLFMTVITVSLLDPLERLVEGRGLYFMIKIAILLWFLLRWITRTSSYHLSYGDGGGIVFFRNGDIFRRRKYKEKARDAVSFIMDKAKEITKSDLLETYRDQDDQNAKKHILKIMKNNELITEEEIKALEAENKDVKISGFSQE